MSSFKTVSQDDRVLRSVEEIGDAVCDVVADQAHALDAVDPARLLPPWAFSQWCEDHRPYQPMRFDFRLNQRVSFHHRRC